MKTPLELKLLLQQFLPKCKGSFNVGDPICCQCVALGDCLCGASQ